MMRRKNSVSQSTAHVVEIYVDSFGAEAPEFPVVILCRLVIKRLVEPELILDIGHLGVTAGYTDDEASLYLLILSFLRAEYQPEFSN